MWRKVETRFALSASFPTRILLWTTQNSVTILLCETRLVWAKLAALPGRCTIEIRPREMYPGSELGAGRQEIGERPDGLFKWEPCGMFALDLGIHDLAPITA